VNSWNNCCGYTMTDRWRSIRGFIGQWSNYFAIKGNGHLQNSIKKPQWYCS